MKIILAIKQSASCMQSIQLSQFWLTYDQYKYINVKGTGVEAVSNLNIEMAIN